MERLRFPPPWSAVELEEAFAIRDATGFTVAFVYFEDEAGKQTSNRFTKEEARRIATNVARVPQLLMKD